MIDKLVDLLFDVSVGVLKIMLVVTAAIDLEFALSPPYTVDVLVGEWYETVGNIDVSINVV